MVKLRDPFEVTHLKDIKNKQGQVVRQVDYIGWSQAADRLDEASESQGVWWFEIIQSGTDWVHGRLHVGNRFFDNFGYAENADADWKKEPLKDAASDALKRCAALAGVARYLYDKDEPSQPVGRPQAARRAAPTPLPQPESDPRWDGMGPPDEPDPWPDSDTCAAHGIEWKGDPGDRYHRLADGHGYCRNAPGNVPKRRSA